MSKFKNFLKNYFFLSYFISRLIYQKAEEKKLCLNFLKKCKKVGNFKSITVDETIVTIVLAHETIVFIIKL